MTSKSFLLFFLFSSLLFGSLYSGATSIEVPVIRDIREEAKLAQKNNLPILIIFSSDHCPFCDLVKEDFLKPMLISGDYTHRTLIREVNVDDGNEMINFDGQEISADTFTYRYNVSLFPTMLMLDYHGKKVSHRILGVNTPEMFGGRIDAMIDKANMELGNKITKN